MFEIQFAEFDFRDFMDFVLNLADHHGLKQVRFNPERRELFDDFQLKHISPSRNVDDPRGFVWAWSKKEEQVRKVSFKQFDNDEAREVHVSIDLDQKTIRLDSATGISEITIEELAKKRFGQDSRANSRKADEESQEEPIFKLQPEFYGFGVNLGVLYRSLKKKLAFRKRSKNTGNSGKGTETRSGLLGKYWWFLVVPVVVIVIGYVITEGELPQIFKKFFSRVGEGKEELVLPVFKYDYSQTDQLFYINAPLDTQIIEARWTFASKWTSGQDPTVSEFVSINEFPTKLSRGILEDFLSREAGINNLTQLGKDMLECVLLAYAQDGIPALVTITYDHQGQGATTTKDLLLIARLDTPYPEVVPGPRNITQNNEIFDFFNKYIFYLNKATQQVNQYKETPWGVDYDNYTGQLRDYNGDCGFRLNQPIDGY